MNTAYATLKSEQVNKQGLNFPLEKFTSLIGDVYGGLSGNPNPDEPFKPGPWGPIIRKVSQRVFGPQSEPWFSNMSYSTSKPFESKMDRMILRILANRHPEVYDAIGDDRFSWAALNPQPLPPVATFVAAFTEEVVDRAVLIQEVADALSQGGNEPGPNIAEGRISMLVDELCGNSFRLKIPIPIPSKNPPLPPPKRDTDGQLSGLELIIAGTVCAQSAAIVANESLQQALKNGGQKLIETGMDRI